MHRFVFVLVLASAACGEDPDPHVVGACSGWLDNQGNPFTGQCEAACQMQPASTGNTCDTVTQLNCMKFEFHEIDGCCVLDNTTIRFYECQF